MTQRTVRQEVTDKLKVWAASKSPAIKIAFENISFTKPTTPWVELLIIPVTTQNNDITASRSTLYGMIQINIFTPINTGTAEAEDLAQELLALYPVVPKTGTVSIEQTGSILRPSIEAQWRVTPIRFNYRQEQY